MPTRAAAARKAAGTIPKNRSVPPKATALRRPPTAKSHLSYGGDGQDDDVSVNGGTAPSGADEVEITESAEEPNIVSSPAKSAKRKRALGAKNGNVSNRGPVKGGWDELPHNMGTMNGGVETSAQEVEIPEATEEIVGPSRKKAKRGGIVKKEPVIKSEPDGVKKEIAVKSEHSGEEKIMTEPIKSRSRAKRGKAATAESTELTADPITAELKDEFKDVKDEDIKEEKPKNKRTPRSKNVDTSDDVQKKVGELLETVDKPVKKVKKGKKNPYGLTPGETPFPDFVKPTVDDCNMVNDLLSAVHGKVVPPKEIPAPSLEVTGCGEVPSVLDALIRTRLSASTTSTNAGYAFAGLVARYGVLKEGIGAGSVDWNKVRLSDVKDIETAIKKGGLAATKSKSIKAILERVYEQNITRTDSFIAERDTGAVSTVLGADKLTQGQKDLELECREKGILSLDYMHGLTADEAMVEFVQYPGIGVKTASCVILFCMRRPSFAVDTHVFRLCSWLGWIPEKATRDTAFSHCEVRVPNELKYPLHQLLIRHGKTCGRCRAITGENSEGWENANCPIEHLVTRSGLRKGGSSPMKKGGASKANETKSKTTKSKAKTPKKGKKARKADEWNSDSEMDDDDEVETPILGTDNDDDSELSELESLASGDDN